MPRPGTDSATRPRTSSRTLAHDNRSRSGPRRCAEPPSSRPTTVFAPLVPPRARRLSARARPVRTAQHGAGIHVPRDPPRRVVPGVAGDLPRGRDGAVHRVPTGFTGDFLDGETLQRVSLDRRYDLPPEFVGEAL